MPTGTLPVCPLVVALNPPASVTADSTTKNTLLLNVSNPQQSSTAVVLENSRGGVQMDAPMAMAALAIEPATDCIFVYAPWGTGAGDLSSAANAASITVAPSAGTDWLCGPMTDPTKGPYFILYPPPGSTTLDPGESVQFSFSNIISDLPVGMATLYVEMNITDYKPITRQARVFKVAASS